MYCADVVGGSNGPGGVFFFILQYLVRGTYYLQSLPLSMLLKSKMEKMGSSV